MSLETFAAGKHFLVASYDVAYFSFTGFSRRDQ